MMPCTTMLTLPRALLDRALRTLFRGGLRFLDHPVGVVRGPGQEVIEIVLARHPTPTGDLLRIRLADEAAPPLTGDFGDERVLGSVVVGDGRRLGECAGVVRSGTAGFRPITELKLLGAGLDRLEVGVRFNQPQRSLVPLAPGSDRWSRTQRALGELTHRRATALRAGVVGCGRSGSLLATQLARFGLESVVLVDPDRVELGNLGESEFGEDDLGMTKVEAVQRRLKSDFPGMHLEPVAQSAAQLYAIEALKRCDVLFCAPDQPAPRLVAAILAAAFARPLIDLGTQVHRRPGQSLMGADVRLVLPDRCLFCFGGVRGERAGWEMLRDPGKEREFLRTRDWTRERQGSLRSLNLMAIALALRLFEDWAAGHIGESRWLHAEWDNVGALTLTAPAAENSALTPCACALCGWADAGIGQLGPFARERSRAVFE